MTTAHTLYQALCARYEAPEYCVDREITLAGRRIDAIALRMWGDNLLLGFEIKVTRSDWQREIKQLEKSRDWARAVDQFYVVAPAGVVLPDELPVGWGLIEWREAGLRLKAQPHPATPSPTITREVAARLIGRQQTKRIADDFETINRQRIDLRAEIRKQCDAEHERTTARLREELASANKLIADIQSLAGVSPRDWNKEKKLLHLARTLSYLQQESEPTVVVDRFVRQAREHAERANSIVAAVEKLVAEMPVEVQP